MALTITDAGNGVSTTSTATVATGATVTASVGDMLVAIIAADNAGAAGVASLTSVTDSAGNTWTQRAIINQTGGSANDGATLGIFTCIVTNALASGTVTANFSPNTTSKAIEVYRAQPGVGETVQFVATDATGSVGSGVTTHSAPTVSANNGDTILGAAALQTNGTITGDSDTTNGNWSAIVTRLANSGSSLTSMTNSSQLKTVSATGNQSWACTTGIGASSARTYLIIGPLPNPALIFNPNPFLPFLVR